MKQTLDIKLIPNSHNTNIHEWQKVCNTRKQKRSQWHL